MSMESLPLQEIADKCHEHTQLFYDGKPHDPAWCFELLRRALRLEDDDAFEYAYHVYYPQVIRWIYHHPRFKLTHRDAEDFAHTAIYKLWYNLRGKKFDRFDRLDAVLQYLKLCVHSTIWDHIKNEGFVFIVELEIAEFIGKVYPLTNDIHVLTILDCVQQALNDEVLMKQFQLWVIYDMKPSDIVAETEGFEDAQQISRLRQRIKYRLENSKTLKTCLEGYLIPA